MNNHLPKIRYDEKSDALMVVIAKGAEFAFDEISPGVFVEQDDKGRVIGFEVLNASKVLRPALEPLVRKAGVLTAERRFAVAA